MIIASNRAWSLITYYFYCSAVSLATGVADTSQLIYHRQRNQEVGNVPFEISDA